MWKLSLTPFNFLTAEKILAGGRTKKVLCCSEPEKVLFMVTSHSSLTKALKLASSHFLKLRPELFFI